VFAAVIAGGASWYLGRHAKTPAGQQTQVGELVVASEPAAEEPKNDAKTVAPTNNATQNNSSQSNAAQSNTTPPTSTSPPPRPSRSAGAPPPGKVRVRLTFASESWVEVYDAGGNRMLYDVGRADFPRMIDVEPPALVVLGDARVVTTEANDKVVSIPQKNLSGTVARFTIAADGSVR
jgi:hypothetical protein